MIKKTIALTMLTSPALLAGEQGHLTKEVWNNLPGYRLSDILSSPRFYEKADEVESFEGVQSSNHGGAAAVRIRGYVTVPVDGNYSFAISGDDAAVLKIATDGNKFKATAVASFDHWTAQKQWDKYESQISKEIALKAGQKIFIEVLLKEGGGADGVSLGWITPETEVVELIPSNVIESYLASEDTQDLNANELPDTWEAQYALPEGQSGLLDDPDKDGYPNIEEAQLGMNPTVRGGVKGYLSYERWNDFGSARIESIKSLPEFRLKPDVSELVSAADAPINQGSNFAGRLHGYIIPPASGQYTFWVSGDDNVSLSLSSDESKFNAVEIASHKGWTGHKQFDRYASQKSAGIELVGGQKYYLSALMKEASGGDSLSVAWQAEGLDATNWTQEAGVTASQSSTGWNGGAEKAIDGNFNPVYEGWSVTHTLNEQNSWWKTDLGANRSIEEVVVINRNIVQNRLSNFKVSIISATGEVVASKSYFEGTGNAGKGIVWKLDQAVQGQTVKIELLGSNNDGDGYLSIAEVKVLSKKSPIAHRQVIPSSAIESYAFDQNDVDNDGMKDDWEVANDLNPELNDALLDADGDNAPNWLEFEAGSDPQVKGSVQGGLVHELWSGISGRFVSDLKNSPKFLGKPNVKSISTWSAGPFNWGANHGNRLRGYITAPESGIYYFHAEGNKQVELKLSTDEDKFNAESLIKTVHFNWINNFNFNFDIAQKSKPVVLAKGQKYYVEVLHKSTDKGGDHFSIAWTKPDGVQQLIPTELLSTYAGQENDKDDDGLLDAWELENGLSITDNGAVNPVNGAQGDLDGDGLTNAEEQKANTAANMVDSDGDGVNDYDEIKVLDTSAIVGDVAPFEEVQSLAGSDYVATEGVWTKKDGQATHTSVRGSVEYKINVAKPGVYMLDLELVTASAVEYSDEYELVFSVDGVELDRVFVNSKEGVAANAKVLTPFLSAGTHNVKVYLDNSLTYRKASFNSLKVLASAGADADANGQPDWVDKRMELTNDVGGGILQSKVSPAFIEGKAKFLSLATGIDYKAAPGGRWFGYVDLDDTGADTGINLSFENNGRRIVKTLNWLPTNLFDEQQITVRKGSSLRLTAYNEEAADKEVTLTIDGESVSFDADQPKVISFDSAGEKKIEVLTKSKIDGSTTSGIAIVKVLELASVEPTVVAQDYWREWNVPALPENAVLELDEQLIVREAKVQENGSTTYTLMNTSSKDVPAIVRDVISGDILSSFTVKGFRFRSAGETSLTFVGVKPDGSREVDMPVVANGLHDGLEFEYQIFIGGVVFDNGSLTKTMVNVDFDETGSYMLKFLKSGSYGATCHRSKVYYKGKLIAYTY